MNAASVSLIGDRQIEGRVDRFDAGLPDFVIRSQVGPTRVRFCDVGKIAFFSDAMVPADAAVGDRPLAVRIVGGEILHGRLGRQSGQQRGIHLIPVEPGSVAGWYVPIQAVREVDAIEGRAAQARGMAGKRIGDILLELGFVSREQLDAAVAVQHAMPGMRLGRLLIEMGFTTDKTVAVALALQFDMPFASIAAETIDSSLRTEVSEAFARRWRVLPLRRERGRLHVATTDPTQLDFRHELRSRTGMLVRGVMVASEELDRATDAFYCGGDAVADDDRRAHLHRA